MKKLLILSCLLATVSVMGSELNYKDQKNWEFISGKRQSPINIETEKVTEAKNYSKVKINFKNNILEKVENNGHTLDVFSKGESVLDNRKFELKNLHFHSPSEHTINGEFYPLELHFVHQMENGEYAVVAVFAKEGQENKEFQKVLESVGKEEKNIDLEKLLPKKKEYYTYLGSLTTPPLTENVEWYVLKEPIEVSKSQIEQFNKFYIGNNRKVQDVNDRKILFVK